MLNENLLTAAVSIVTYEVKMNRNNKLILCVGTCVLDIVHICREYPEEDSDRRLVFFKSKSVIFL